MFAETKLMTNTTWLFKEHAPSASAVRANIAFVACNGPLTRTSTVGLVGSHGWPQVMNPWCNTVSLRMRRALGCLAFRFVVQNRVHGTWFTLVMFRKNRTFHGKFINAAHGGLSSCQGSQHLPPFDGAWDREFMGCLRRRYVSTFISRPIIQPDALLPGLGQGFVCRYPSDFW